MMTFCFALLDFQGCVQESFAGKKEVIFVFFGEKAAFVGKNATFLSEKGHFFAKIGYLKEVSMVCY